MVIIQKVQQFLRDEKELLEDFVMDMEDADDDRAHSKAAALWAMQTARVGAIKDVLALFGLQDETDEELAEHVCKECGAITLYSENQLQMAHLEGMAENQIVECDKCGCIERY